MNRSKDQHTHSHHWYSYISWKVFWENIEIISLWWTPHRRGLGRKSVSGRELSPRAIDGTLFAISAPLTIASSSFFFFFFFVVLHIYMYFQ